MHVQQCVANQCYREQKYTDNSLFNLTHLWGHSGCPGSQPTGTLTTFCTGHKILLPQEQLGTGREYLNLDGSQLVCCQATTLLVGCSSGRLSVAGSCDPQGNALYYLTAGWLVGLTIE